MVWRSTLIAIKAVWLLDEAITRACLDKRHALVSAYLAELNDVLILQKVVFEDDLEDGALCSDQAVDGLDLMLDIVPLAAEGLADVDDHVDLGGPRGDGLGGLGNLERGGGRAVRETDDGADADWRPGEDGTGEGHGVRLDAGRGHGGVTTEGEAGTELGVGEGWVEEGVVDDLGEMREGDFDCGGGGGGGGGGDHGWAGDEILMRGVQGGGGLLCMRWAR